MGTGFQISCGAKESNIEREYSPRSKEGKKGDQRPLRGRKELTTLSGDTNAKRMTCQEKEGNRRRRPEEA